MLSLLVCTDEMVEKRSSRLRTSFLYHFFSVKSCSLNRTLNILQKPLKIVFEDFHPQKFTILIFDASLL